MCQIECIFTRMMLITCVREIFFLLTFLQTNAENHTQVFGGMLNNSALKINSLLISQAFILSKYFRIPEDLSLHFFVAQSKNVDQPYVCTSIYSSLSSANHTNPALSSPCYRLAYSSHTWVFQLNSQSSVQSHLISPQVRLDSDVYRRELA